jgi:hypothetical protein
MKREERPAKRNFAKAGLSRFYGCEALSSSFVNVMKFIASQSAPSPNAKILYAK